jgi:hypothetical protein
MLSGAKNLGVFLLIDRASGQKFFGSITGTQDFVRYNLLTFVM